MAASRVKNKNPEVDSNRQEIGNLVMGSPPVTVPRKPPHPHKWPGGERHPSTPRYAPAHALRRPRGRPDHGRRGRPLYRTDIAITIFLNDPKASCDGELFNSAFSTQKLNSGTGRPSFYAVIKEPGVKSAPCHRSHARRATGGRHLAYRAWCVIRRGPGNGSANCTNSGARTAETGKEKHQLTDFTPRDQCGVRCNLRAHVERTTRFFSRPLLVYGLTEVNLPYQNPKISEPRQARQCPAKNQPGAKPYG